MSIMGGIEIVRILGARAISMKDAQILDYSVMQNALICIFGHEEKFMLNTYCPSFLYSFSDYPINFGA